MKILRDRSQWPRAISRLPTSDPRVGIRRVKTKKGICGRALFCSYRNSFQKTIPRVYRSALQFPRPLWGFIPQSKPHELYDLHLIGLEEIWKKKIGIRKSKIVVLVCSLLERFHYLFLALSVIYCWLGVRNLGFLARFYVVSYA